MRDPQIIPGKLSFVIFLLLLSCSFISLTLSHNFQKKFLISLSYFLNLLLCFPCRLQDFFVEFPSETPMLLFWKVHQESCMWTLFSKFPTYFQTIVAFKRISTSHLDFSIPKNFAYWPFFSLMKFWSWFSMQPVSLYKNKWKKKSEIME